MKQPPAPGTSIRSISSRIIDIPTIREHKLSSLSVSVQSCVLVEVLTEDGVAGYGEAATLGGPGWSEESVETIKTVTDRYLAPALHGHTVDRPRDARKTMDSVAKRNNAAKAAIETALLDAFGKTINRPVHSLLGGLVRSAIPVHWALASGDPAQEIDEALAMIAQRRHKTFKVKIGAATPGKDIARLNRIAAAIEGKGEIYVVDANQAWDEVTADRWMPALFEMGVTLLEQPLPAWNLAGSARLAARHPLPILADESVFSAPDAASVASLAAADAVSLKLVKHGGILSLMDVAATSHAGGLGLYGGCLLEGTVGTAAQLHAFGALDQLTFGCESFGPRILHDDLSVTPVSYSNFQVTIPTGPGLGVELDLKKVAFHTR